MRMCRGFRMCWSARRRRPPVSEQPASLAAALIQLQSRLPRITKDTEGQIQSRTYKYANLASIHDAILPLLGECGLAWITMPTLFDGGFVLHYRLIHAVSGTEEDGWYPLPAGGTPQQVGSAITYARRYTLTAVLGIAPAEDDDDGAAAESHAKASYADRVAAGRMNRSEVREHAALARETVSQPRLAERVSGPAPDAADWETGNGPATTDQLVRIGKLFDSTGISREDRLPLVMSVLDLPEIHNAKELSESQADYLITYLDALEQTSEGGV